jgi:hypothetical protein
MRQVVKFSKPGFRVDFTQVEKMVHKYRGSDSFITLLNALCLRRGPVKRTLPTPIPFRPAPDPASACHL